MTICGFESHIWASFRPSTWGPFQDAFTWGSVRSTSKKAALVLWVHYFGSPLTSRTLLNNMFGKEPKKSSKTSQLHISMGIIPSNIAVGPFGFGAELAATAKSEQSRSHRELEANDPDLTVALDMKDTRALRIVPQENKDEDQGFAVTKVSTPDTVVGGTKQGNDPTSERF